MVSLPVWLLGTSVLCAAEGSRVVELERHRDLATFYVNVHVGSDQHGSYLVDTGAGYMTITEATLRALQERGDIAYLRELEGVMADGRSLRVPVYRLAQITVDGSCVIRDVEAAVVPGATRGLLGLSALAKTAPFVFSTNPPSLHLSNCAETPPVSATASTGQRPNTTDVAPLN